MKRGTKRPADEIEALGKAEAFDQAKLKYLETLTPLAAKTKTQAEIEQGSMKILKASGHKDFAVAAKTNKKPRKSLSGKALSKACGELDKDVWQSQLKTGQRHETGCRMLPPEYTGSSMNTVCRSPPLLGPELPSLMSQVLSLQGRNRGLLGETLLGCFESQQFEEIRVRFEGVSSVFEGQE